MNDLIEPDNLIDAHILMINRYRFLINASNLPDKYFLLNFCDTAVTLTNTDKFSRWIGFLQGILFERGMIDIEEERNVSRQIYKPIYDALNMDSRTVDVKEE